MSVLNRIGIDVSTCQGQGYRMQFTNDFINPYATFDNMLGVYFERADQSIIPEAIVIYPRTHGVDLSDFFEYIPVPSDAVWMGYFIQPNANAQWAGRPNHQYLDRVEVRKDTDGFTRLYALRDYTDRDNPDRRVRWKGSRILTSGYAGQTHLSNPANNYGNYEWFKREDDGSVLAEDLGIGTGWDFGLWWSAPRSLVPCDCFKT